MLLVSLTAAAVFFLRLNGSHAAELFPAASASERSLPVSAYRRPPLPPEKGPGGPILVISSDANHFTSYYAEILRNEGFNEFAVEDIADVSPRMLRRYDIAILGEMPLNPASAAMLNSWVRSGGNLIAMRPAKPLGRLLDVEAGSGVLEGGYLAIAASAAAGRGLVRDTIQFHGPADLYDLRDGSAVATLYRDAATPTASPAVLGKTVGSGRIAVFAYDLARSIVYTRQGNPAWSGMERDGMPPMRTDDLFYGAASYDMRPDWVDMAKVSIPQADEQQRLLANLILEMNARKKPLPRFWYFPRGLKAVVVMTGDDHGHGGTIDRFKHFREISTPRCSLNDWQCVRGTSNIFLGSIPQGQAADASGQGFEVGLHIFTGCEDWPRETVRTADGRTVSRISWEDANSLYSHQLAAFSSLYPGLPRPVSSRIDCITWGDYDTQPQVELANGIRLDTNYYYWPAMWVKNRPGVFTGSGMPMRLAKEDGSLIDVYQAATQMTDESGQSYPYTINSLLDRAFGPEQYYGAFTANMHTDESVSRDGESILGAAKARGVPVISAAQMLAWLDGRNSSSFQSLSGDAAELRFDIATADGADGLQALLPMASATAGLAKLTLNGAPVNYEPRIFAGLEYAAFPALPGKYVARYGLR
jgi:hypothetical protein